MYYHVVRVGSRVVFAENQPRPHTHNMIQSMKVKNIKGYDEQAGQAILFVFFKGTLM